MKISSLAYDRVKEEDGVWIEWVEGVQLRIARWNNPKYLAYIRKRTATSGIRTRILDHVQDWIIEATAKFILKNWKNIQDDAGEEILHSEEKSLEFLNKYPDLFEFVQEVAQDKESYRVNEQEESVGN